MVVGIYCCFLCLFFALGEGASRDSGHECEQLLTLIAMTIVCACVGSDLYAMLSGGFSLKDTSLSISANVRVCKLRALLITIGIIWTWSFFFCCVSL